MAIRGIKLTGKHPATIELPFTLLLLLDCIIII